LSFYSSKFKKGEHLNHQDARPFLINSKIPIMNSEQARLLIIPNITASVHYEKEGGLGLLLARWLDLPEDSFEQFRLLRLSLDARRRKFSYKMRAEVLFKDAKTAKAVLKSGKATLPSIQKAGSSDHAVLKGLTPGSGILNKPPLIVGTGPAGLFAAWLLCQYGFRPILLERGRRVEQRIRDVRSFEQGGPFLNESNVLFGEGGAGTFSDGKLTCRTRSPLKQKLLELMVECSAPGEILYQSKAHIGTDRLRAVLIHLRRKLTEGGAIVRFESLVEELLLDSEGSVRGVRLQTGEELLSKAVLLGIGHSARDTYQMLYDKGVALEFKPFQLGLRVEHRQDSVDVFRYGGGAASLGLPTAEYALKTNKTAGQVEVFSFCMCPGGVIVPSISEAGSVCTNGMSRHRRDSGWANSGLVYTLTAEAIGSDHALAGIHVQQEIEKIAFEMGRDYQLPAQRIPDFLKGRLSNDKNFSSTYPLGHVAADLRQLLPGPGRKIMAQGIKAFDRIWKGFAGPEALLVGPESRGSSPVRMPRDPESRESTSTSGLYPMGEGAGYAGGIMSAALDGVRTAQSVIEKYKSPNHV
jgi:uncharacterized protein